MVFFNSVEFIWPSNCQNGWSIDSMGGARSYILQIELCQVIVTSVYLLLYMVNLHATSWMFCIAFNVISVIVWPDLHTLLSIYPTVTAVLFLISTYLSFYLWFFTIYLTSESVSCRLEHWCLISHYDYSLLQMSSFPRSITNSIRSTSSSRLLWKR